MRDGEYFYSFYMDNPDPYLEQVLNAEYGYNTFSAEAYAEIVVGEVYNPLAGNLDLIGESWQELIAEAKRTRGFPALPILSLLGLAWVETGGGEFVNLDAGGLRLDIELASFTSRAARRQVMRDLNIPTSQQPIQVYTSSGGRTAYVYEVPAPGGGTRKMVVSQHPLDVNHGPHWEGGVVKIDDQGNVRLNPYSMPLYYNTIDGRPKPRVTYRP
ncbi:MAG: hypothetical protein SXV54_14625 [Chloroflexota bacterium]|nr:hypothetical protein [Chloroflexota bacterium]